ncbi:hypothetical protein TSAR_001375, partial [Trichomalopsis sarcophagae]
MRYFVHARGLHVALAWFVRKPARVRNWQLIALVA